MHAAMCPTKRLRVVKPNDADVRDGTELHEVRKPAGAQDHGFGVEKRRPANGSSIHACQQLRLGTDACFFRLACFR